MSLSNLLNLSQYAKTRKARGLPGGTTQAVLNAVNSGRIPFVTVGKNKFVDPDKADRAWAVNTDTTRYDPTQMAATLPATTTTDQLRTLGQAEALQSCLESSTIVAGVLVKELGLQPQEALRIAAQGVFTLTYTLGEIFDNHAFLHDFGVPEWLVELTEGNLGYTAVTRALDNVAHIAKTLEDDPPLEDDPLTLKQLDMDIRRGMAELGV